jgi:hypothetical protein
LEKSTFPQIDGLDERKKKDEAARLKQFMTPLGISNDKA